MAEFLRHSRRATARLGTVSLPPLSPANRWLLWMAMGTVTVLLWVLTASPLRALIERKGPAQEISDSGTWRLEEKTTKAASLF